MTPFELNPSMLSAAIATRASCSSLYSDQSRNSFDVSRRSNEPVSMDEFGSYAYRKTTHVATGVGEGGGRSVGSGSRSMTLFTAGNKSVDVNDAGARRCSLRSDMLPVRIILISANASDPVVRRRSAWHRACYSAPSAVRPGLICRRQYGRFQTISFRVMRAVGASKCRSGPTMEMRFDDLWRRPGASMRHIGYGFYPGKIIRFFCRWYLSRHNSLTQSIAQTDHPVVWRRPL